jgi:rare lipoprotein A
VLLFLFSAVGCRSWLPWGGFQDRGLASWYGNEYNGRPTACGETFDEEAMTAAHRDLPFGTVVEVTNLKNGKSVRVRINDRGPFVHGRIIDLSKGAARKIDMINDGVVPVQLKLL